MAVAAGAISPARRAAFELLQRIGSTSTHSDDALHGPTLAPLSEVDRHLATALVLGVLRWQIALDARLRPLLSRPDTALAEPVAIALRLGAFQLWHMERIPAHAAVHESVELVRAAGHAHAAGMVNALLRKVGTLPAPRRPMVEQIAAMAERLGHPFWLVERWSRVYGRTAAEAICAFDQEEPLCHTLFEDGDDFAAPVMDPGSRLVAEIAAVAGRSAKNVWDCCAAPGGKTIVLGRRLREAQLLATDASPVRLRRLAERLRRELPDREVQTLEAQAESLPSSFGNFDMILCDVPCSGTGTLARNPEIRHRLRPGDLERQATRQRRLLRAAIERLAPGGRLVYSTCSLEPEECREIVNDALREVGTRIERLPVRPILEALVEQRRLVAPAEEMRAWTDEGCLRTLPGAGFNGDGFFACVLERR